MRRGRRPEFITDESDLIGISLSSDFCTEHEHGIDRINRAFGISNEDIIGPDRYKITRCPDALYFTDGVCDGREVVALAYTTNFPRAKISLIDYLVRIGEATLSKLSKDSTIGAAWSDKDFAIIVDKKKHLKWIKRINQALLDLDAMIWLGGGHPFQNAGLVIGIHSQLPDIAHKQMKDAHKEVKWIKEEDQRIDESHNLRDKLKEAGLTWFALFHYKIQDTKSLKTKYGIYYWLNPVDQQKYQWGMYTVEQLLEFANGNEEVLLKKKE
jgi:hypothetical protein